MRTDTKQSLMAFFAVTSFFLFGYLFVQTIKGVDLPRWLPLAGLAVQSTAGARWLIRRRRERVGRSTK